MPPHPTSRISRRILLLTSNEQSDAELADLFGDRAEVRVVHSIEEAAEALRDDTFDLVLSGTADLLPLGEATAGRSGVQQRFDAIDAAGRELVGVDADAMAQMDVTDRLQYLEDKIISICRDLLRFDHFAIMLVDEKTQRMDTLLSSDLVEADSLNIYADANSKSITGYVAATGRSYLCADVSKDDRYQPGLEGARSSMTVPLCMQDRVIGVLNVESEEAAAFSEDDCRFAEIFARYIALALHILQLLIVERHTSTGQLAADVDAELATPLNQIVANVARLMVDYPNDAALRSRLEAVIDDVETVREALSSVAKPDAISGMVPQASERDPLLTGKRVLVADDEDIIRETIADVLSRLGAKTIMANDGDEAVSLVRSQDFDLVLSDIKMPHRNGYEVFAAVRERSPDCPVILITGFGYDPNHSIVSANREGLAGVLFKPFKVDAMLAAVRKALGKTSGADKRN